jgi:hypothetical protein
MDLSAEAFASLSNRFEKHINQWLDVEKHAQQNRTIDVTSMDIYDTSTDKCMDIAYIMICLLIITFSVTAYP